MTKDEIHTRIKLGLYMLVHNDRYLMEKDLHERTITHKLANYYEKLFRDWDVDCEYNKNVDVAKAIHNEHHGCHNIFPDIIIHRRGNNDSNLAVIELKKTTNDNEDGRKNDISKLSELVKGPYNYKYAYSIDIPTGDNFAGASTEFSVDPYSEPDKSLDDVYTVKEKVEK